MDNWIVILVIVAISFLKWLFGENGLKRMFEDREAPPPFSPKSDTANTRPPPRTPVGTPAPPLRSPVSRWPEGRPEMRPSQGPQSIPNPSHRRAASSSGPGRSSEEEKVRKFLEALGLPADAAVPAPARERAPQRPIQSPPPPVRQLPVPPPIPVAPPPIPAPLSARQSRAARVAEDAARPPQAFVSPKEEVRREHEADVVSLAAQREKQKRAYSKGMGHEIGVKRAVGELKRGAAIRERLRNPGGLADAVLLAEILREPVGMRRS